MSVSILTIGDPHFKVNNIVETEKMVDAIVNVALEKKPDLIVVLGDVLDRHETIHVSPLNRSIMFLERLSRISPTYVLIGNHDLKNNRQFLSTEHPFKALEYWYDTKDFTKISVDARVITIVDTPKSVVIRGQLFVFVPYVPPGRFMEALEELDWKEASCIFAHQEFKGSKLGSNVSEEGDGWLLTNPYIVSGHIHDYHEPQPNIIYTGTPIQHAFGDHQDKTISYFTFISATERIHQRIDLMLLKKHVVHLQCEDVNTYIPRENCELKIVITGTSGDNKAIKKHPNVIFWQKQGIKVCYKDIPITKDFNYEKIDKHIKFSDELYNNVKTNQRLETLYTKLFGKTTQETKISTPPPSISLPSPSPSPSPKKLIFNIKK
jgi:DNA repair exonuclease SbcCD nuclease subunit